MKETLILCLLGPSGSGKSAIASELKKQMIPAVVSHRTREKREKEEHGVDGYFVSREKFLEYDANNAFCAKTEYHGNLYGLSWGELRHFKMIGRDVVSYVVDSTGLDALKKEVDGKEGHRVLSVGIVTPMEMLKKRMVQRGEDEATIERRIATYEKEQGDITARVDYLVGNVDGMLERAVSEIMGIIQREKE